MTSPPARTGAGFCVGEHGEDRVLLVRLVGMSLTILVLYGAIWGAVGVVGMRSLLRERGGLFIRA